jgi:hypothetical protein
VKLTKVFFQVYQDLDGSLTGGTAGDVVISKENITLFNPSCRDTGQFKNGLVCSNTKTWIRFVIILLIKSNLL